MSAIEQVKAMQEQLIQLQQLLAVKDMEREELVNEISELSDKIEFSISLGNEYEKKIEDREKELQAAFNTLLIQAKGAGTIDRMLSDFKSFAIESQLEIPDQFEPPTEKESVQEDAA